MEFKRFNINVNVYIYLPGKPNNCLKEWWRKSMEGITLSHDRILLHSGLNNINRNCPFQWLRMIDQIRNNKNSFDKLSTSHMSYWVNWGSDLVSKKVFRGTIWSEAFFLIRPWQFLTTQKHTEVQLVLERFWKPW